jgi:hypothetical protein
MGTPETWQKLVLRKVGLRRACAFYDDSGPGGGASTIIGIVPLAY